ncbi:unnamed protein product [Camellia sinensis]
MGLVSVFGNEVDAYYDKLLAGESGIRLIDRFDASKFPTRFAGQIRGFNSQGYIDGKNDRRLDDCLRYCIVAGKKALEAADLGGDRLGKIDKERAGVLVGTGMGGLTVFSDGVQALIERGYRKITPFFIPYAITNMGSALLAIELGFMGPNYSISTACATSNYCFYAAANHIRRGEADLMIAGGTEAAIIPIGLGGFVACRALSQRNDDPQTASRPWDKERDGFVMGEGSGVLVLESLEHAMKRGAPIIAEYLGGAVNCDAYHMTDPRADGLGVSSCIERSLEDAGVSPEEVNYINAHATSTPAGDVAEVNAIKKVFKNTSEIKMNSTKSMIGHCLGAAGGLEAIASVKAINTGWLHPTINQFNLEPSVEFDTVANKKQQHEVNVAAMMEGSEITEKEEVSVIEKRKIFVAGATGNTGKRIVQQILAKGFAVKAGVRDVDKAKTSFSDGNPDLQFERISKNGTHYACASLYALVNYPILLFLRGKLATENEFSEIMEISWGMWLMDEVKADVTEGSTKLAEAIGADSDAVICATGFRPSLDLLAPWKVDNFGTVNLVEACRKLGVNRFILVSSILVNGAAMGQLLNPAYIILNVFGLTLIAKLQAEKHIRKSGINYTIIRPGGLRNDPPNGNIVMEPEDTLYKGSISRNQVAEVAVEALNHQEASYKVVEIVARTEAPKRSFQELFGSIKQQ